MAEFRPHWSELRERGVEVAIIGSGSPHFARAFAEDQKVEMPVFSDEKRVTFEAAGLKHGAATLMHPAMILRGITAFARGHRQKKTMGDALQQGGVLVVMPDGSVPYRFVSRFAGDHPPTPLVVAETFKAAAAAS